MSAYEINMVVLTAISVIIALVKAISRNDKYSKTTAYCNYAVVFSVSRPVGVKLRSIHSPRSFIIHIWS